MNVSLTSPHAIDYLSGTSTFYKTNKTHHVPFSKISVPKWTKKAGYNCEVGAQKIKKYVT